MKDYIGTHIPANWYRGKQIENGEIGFSKTGMCFYYPPMIYNKGKVEIDYSEIVWIEKKKSYKIHPNKMTIFTKKNAEYTFVVNERDDIVEFLDSKVKYTTEKPVDYKERLRNTPGERIKRQYFNIPLYIYASFIIQFIVFIVPLFDIVLGKGNMIKYTIIDMLEMLHILLVFLMPLIVLSILNRFFFGRTVCVINQQGVHLEHGFIPWEKINNIEYEIEVPSRSSRRDYCFARILGAELDVKLMHAPYYFTKRAKKYNSKIKVKFSEGSRFIIGLLALAPLVVTILILLFES